MSKKRSLLDSLLATLDNNHALDVTVIDVREQTSVTDYMVICNGRSSRQVKSIAELTTEGMKALGYPRFGQKDNTNADWILLDFGDVVVHVMQPQIRAFYNLEGLWQHTSES
ncbi:MAG: ribosome silencing factor [Legionellaceae bacterium]|nr:ribosome silencing factor [Legionellaceae bacterium]